MNTNATTCDAVILGGGLAGLTLALQLRKRLPDLRVTVLERKSLPFPEAAHKVGESTVEIGAHYFDKVLGLGEHLKQKHLRKFGFRFFFSEGRRDIDQVTEIGASRHLSVPSYQIDRGIYENHLVEVARERGIEYLEEALVRNVELRSGADPHEVTFECHGEKRTVSTRWVVDACGRAGILKRKLGLAQQNEHASHAVWFRIKSRIVIDNWSSNPHWVQKCDPQARWLSTNHLVGKGYWVWLIPLSSGSHSVGIVADPAIHPFETMDTFDNAMEWLRRFQPLLFDELDDKRHLLQDFAFFKRFSYGCKQVFSADRWALTGEAGVFLDPFYSPGSDFIGISNTFITELIALDQQGQPLGARAQVFDQLYMSFYDSTMALYTQQYPIFGDPTVLPVKVIWDYTFYWGVLAQFFFHQRLTDLSAMAALRSELALCQQLNQEVQVFLRHWSELTDKKNPAVMLDQAKMPWFAALNQSLNDQLDGPQFQERIRQSAQQLQDLARQIAQKALRDHPELRRLPLARFADPAGPTPSEARAEPMFEMCE